MYVKYGTLGITVTIFLMKISYLKINDQTSLYLNPFRASQISSSLIFAWAQKMTGQYLVVLISTRSYVALTDMTARKGQSNTLKGYIHNTFMINQAS